MKHYVVFIGRTCGIHENWDTCKAATNGFKGAKFKGYEDYDEALAAWNAYENDGTLPY